MTATIKKKKKRIILRTPDSSLVLSKPCLRQEHNLVHEEFENHTQNYTASKKKCTSESLSF